VQVAIEEVAQYVASGFRAVKIKVGGQPAEVDARRLAAIRETVGPEIVLMLDANNAWRDLPTALRRMDALMPYDPYWIEELGVALKDNARYRAIQTILGIGPILAALFVAEIGDVGCFASAPKLCSWAGATPKHRESDGSCTAATSPSRNPAR
jgi:transposase